MKEKSLLTWAIKNSNSEELKTNKELKKIDPEIIDAVLGKSDAVLMKEQASLFIDKTKTLEKRIKALSNFEILIESIDNARDIVKIGLWEGIFSCFSDPSVEIRTRAFHITNVAIQNDETVQDSFLKIVEMNVLKKTFYEEKESKVRVKIFSCISSLLKKQETANIFFDNEGESFFIYILRSPITEEKLLNRTIFLLSFLSKDHLTKNYFKKIIKELKQNNIKEDNPFYLEWKELVSFL